jgi:hypothetical protein
MGVPGRREVELGGWAQSPAPVVRVVVEAGLRVRQAAVLDCAECSPGAEQSPGGERRRWVASLPAAALRDGDPSIRIVARDRAGRTTSMRLASSPPIPPRPPWSIEEFRAALEAGGPLLACGRPVFDGSAVVGDALVVEGWAWAAGGIERICAQLGEGPPTAAVSSLPSPNLRAGLGDWPGLANAGFRVLIDTSASPRGLQRLSVVAYGVDGAFASWGTRVS